MERIALLAEVPLDGLEEVKKATLEFSIKHQRECTPQVPLEITREAGWAEARAPISQSGECAHVQLKCLSFHQSTENHLGHGVELAHPAENREELVVTVATECGVHSGEEVQAGRSQAQLLGAHDACSEKPWRRGRVGSGKRGSRATCPPSGT
jgi:hypothetical protein